MPEAQQLRAIPLGGVGEARPGDSVLELLLPRLRRRLRPGDILVVTHKIVSKAEGRVVCLSEVRPRPQARRWAARHGLDARVVELAFQQARRIVRMDRGVLITETVNGLVCANSGVDVSNVDGGRSAVLLPLDPDRSAARLHRELKRRTGMHVPVLITDTFGRPWREGLTEVAIGAAGMKMYRDYRGRCDPHGYRLRVSLEAVADSLAGLAGLAAGKLSRAPACIIRGFRYQPGRGGARALVRPPERDLFR